MKISQVMTSKVVTVEMDDRIAVIKEIFDNVKFHHLMVMEKDELVGVISDRDVLKTLSPFLNTASEQSRDVKTLSKRAHQIMSRTPITATEDMPIENAIELLVEESISCLPVVDETGKLVGVVTWKDILRNVRCEGKDEPSV